MNPKFNQCCAEYIRQIYYAHGGSMNIVHHVTNCKKCGGFIGLTQTNEIEAIKFLKEHNLEYIIK